MTGARTRAAEKRRARERAGGSGGLAANAVPGRELRPVEAADSMSGARGAGAGLALAALLLATSVLSAALLGPGGYPERGAEVEPQRGECAPRSPRRLRLPGPRGGDCLLPRAKTPPPGSGRWAD